MTNYGATDQAQEPKQLGALKYSSPTNDASAASFSRTRRPHLDDGNAHGAARAAADAGPSRRASPPRLPLGLSLPVPGQASERGRRNLNHLSAEQASPLFSSHKLCSSLQAQAPAHFANQTHISERLGRASETATQQPTRPTRSHWPHTHKLTPLSSIARRTQRP